MQSRIEPAVMKLLRAGLALNRHDVAEKCHCNVKHAQRLLAKLHKLEVVRIAKWAREHGGPIGSYVLHDGKPDAPRPQPLSQTEKNKRHRTPEQRLRYAADARNRRQIKKVLAGTIRIGMLGI